MTTFLLDVSVVLALIDPQHVFHDAAHAWGEDEAAAQWRTCPIVQNGVVRIASQPAYSRRLGSSAAVRAVLQEFCAQRRHAFCPDDVSLLDDDVLVRPDRLTPSNSTDLYLLALAVRHGARLATFDRRIPTEAVRGGDTALALIEV